MSYKVEVVKQGGRVPRYSYSWQRDPRRQMNRTAEFGSSLVERCPNCKEVIPTSTVCWLGHDVANNVRLFCSLDCCPMSDVERLS